MRRRPPKRRRRSISLDITPAVPSGRQLIQSYGDGRFRIGGEVYDGPVMVLADETRPWRLSDNSDISLDTLAPVLDASPQGGLLVIGCGARFTAPPKGLRADLKARGFALEWMDTGAACRTFNVLLIEERAAVAALCPVD